MKKMKIDIHTRKTEGEWQEIFGSFLVSLGKAIRTLIEWIIIIAALTIAHSKTDSIYILYVKNLAYFGLLVYLMGIFVYKIEITIFKKLDEMWKWIAESVLNVIVSIAIFILLIIFINLAVNSLVDSGSI